MKDKHSLNTSNLKILDFLLQPSIQVESVANLQRLARIHDHSAFNQIVACDFNLIFYNDLLFVQGFVQSTMFMKFLKQ